MAAGYYRTHTSGRGFLGHVSFGVKSYEVSKKFYTVVLKPLGVDLVCDNPYRKILGYGFDADHAVINIFERGKEAHAPGQGTHFAFNPPSRNAVQEFWDTGIRNGGRNDGEPGLRENYGKDYYTAFIFDPDGFKLEAVCREFVNESELLESRQ